MERELWAAAEQRCGAEKAKRKKDQVIAKRR